MPRAVILLVFGSGSRASCLISVAKVVLVFGVVTDGLAGVQVPLSQVR